MNAKEDSSKPSRERRGSGSKNFKKGGDSRKKLAPSDVEMSRMTNE